MAPRRLLLAALVAVAACTGAPADGDQEAATTVAAGQPPSPSGTVPDPAGDAPATAEDCPSPTLELLAVVADAGLDEISGAAVSPTRADRVWIHEDSGNDPVLTAVALDGTTTASWIVEGVRALDWEDLAAVASPPTLFVADVGDNQGVRDEVQVVRLPEPPPDGSTPDGPRPTPEPAAVVRLVLPRPADAEALLVDPLSGDVVLVTKHLSGRAQVLVAPAAAWADDGEPRPLREVGTLDLGPLSPVLAGDVAADGREVALRTPTRVLRWTRRDGEPVADAVLGRDPCRLPATLDPFGEALALLPQGGYLLIGEGSPADIHRAG